MAKSFITSDLHLGHKNIINFMPQSRGQFKTIDDMNEQIIMNINQIASSPDDTLYILGDIAFCSPKKACDFLSRIIARKVIVWGNHDRKLRHSSEFINRYEELRIVFTADYVSKHIEFSDDVKYPIVLMHFPIWSFEGQGNGAVHLHGHNHSTGANKYTFGRKQRVMDIGMDGNNLFPYDMEEVIHQLQFHEFCRADKHR